MFTNPLLRLSLFLLVTVGGGLLIGLLNVPGQWYSGLAKPSFNPPNWIFGPVWTVLYVMIAIAGWRVTRSDWDNWPARFWATQLILNFFWSPTFFSLHVIGMALGIIGLMLITIVGFTILVVLQVLDGRKIKRFQNERESGRDEGDAPQPGRPHVQAVRIVRPGPRAGD